jgi:hypothetical protein
VPVRTINSIQKTNAALTTAAFIALAGMASAQEAPKAYPHISGELSFEVEDDWTVSSDDPAAELNDMYTTVELGAALNFT